MMQQKKNIKVGKTKILIKYVYLFFVLISASNLSYGKELKNQMNEDNVEIKILDKVSSKTSLLTLKIKEDTKFENLIIKILKCKNSEFDDNPDVIAYMQVQDITISSNDKVFIFNGWTFSSNPSLTPIDHAIYDIWLVGCESV